MMKLLSKSLKLCTVRGIPVKLNITLILLYFLVASGQTFLGGLTMFVMLVGTILMHELAHSLTAQLYGIDTEDITLFFLGGMARLKSMGTAGQEFFITLAGPMSNFLLAGLLFLVFGHDVVPTNEVISPVSYLFLVNVMLAVFNLIPAFPMDGGRILRSSLALLKVKHANMIALRVSQAISIGFLGLGIYYLLPGLCIIALFTFLTAPIELKAKHLS